jgi:hypothetical protein
MQITEHALNRQSERQISEWQLGLVLEHGEWNARGDRLTLGKRSLKNIIADRRRSLRMVVCGQCSRSIQTPQFSNGRDL